MFTPRGLDFESGEAAGADRRFRPIDLEGDLLGRRSGRARRVASRNVIAKLTGAKHPNETISSPAIGTPTASARPTRRGGRSAPAPPTMRSALPAMLEIARLFAAGPRPERTLLFAAWTGEERGLLGSEYYAQHPLYPPETMVANLTLDTLQSAGPVRDVVLIGQGQSEIEDCSPRRRERRAGRHARRPSGARPVLSRRPFLLRQARRAGAADDGAGRRPDLVDGGREAGDRWVSEFTAKCYHQTCDDWSPDWDLRGAAQEADLFYDIGARLANSREWPKWLPTSEFAKVREQSKSARH